jgi:predicted kinase
MEIQKLYVLAGVPGSGKSTWVKENPWLDQAAYVSSDKHVDAYAESQGKTYSEVFDGYIKIATNLMLKEATEARLNRKDIVWDQTSTSVSSRAKKLKMLPEYYAIAVVFPTPDRDELARRLAGRPGKTIPVHVVDSMIKNFVMPSKEEGFREIWRG